LRYEVKAGSVRFHGKINDLKNDRNCIYTMKIENLLTVGLVCNIPEKDISLKSLIKIRKTSLPKEELWK